MKCLTVLALTLLAVSLPAHAVTPCCSVTAIDAGSGIVTANEAATGQSFRFRLGDPAAVRSLHVGQTLFANFHTSQVSLDGKSPSGSIIVVTSPTAGVVGLRPGSSAMQGTPKKNCPAPVVSNQPCPQGATTCQTQTASSSGPGCDTVTVQYQTSTPQSCRPGYWGSACRPCPSNCPSNCSQGIAGNGACPSR
jgi:hypothetical protein